MGNLQKKLGEKFAGWRKKVAEETLIKAIAETVISAVVVGTTAVFAAFKLTSANSGYAPYKAAFIVAGIALAAVASFFVYRRKRRKFRPKFDAIESDFVIEQLEIRYQWKSPHEIIYTRQYRLRALKNDVERFTDKFRWSGNGKCHVNSSVSQHKIDRHSPDSLYDRFDICFDRPYQKDQLIHTGAIWHLDDLKCESRPFISRTIYEPTEELMLTVELPAAWGIENVSIWESPCAGAKKNVKADTLLVTNGKCSWPPQKPLKLMHHYEMRWHWPESLQPNNPLKLDERS